MRQGESVMDRGEGSLVKIVQADSPNSCIMLVAKVCGIAQYGKSIVKMLCELYEDQREQNIL